MWLGVGFGKLAVIIFWTTQTFGMHVYNQPHYLNTIWGRWYSDYSVCFFFIRSICYSLFRLLYSNRMDCSTILLIKCEIVYFAFIAQVYKWKLVLVPLRHFCFWQSLKNYSEKLLNLLHAVNGKSSISAKFLSDV